jgi:bifunctional enzyme CysN/CysC
MSGLFCFWLFVIDHQTGTQRTRIMATERTAKGLHRKAIAAVITAFTGVSDLFEPPSKPEIELQTDRASVDQSVDLALALLAERGYDA